MKKLAVDSNAVIKPKRILCLSDIHPGSNYGLLPPSFESSAGHVVQQNIGQQYLWECWNDCIEWACREPLEGIIINGDVVEGKQPKSRCSELCLPLVRDQEDAAKLILGPLVSRAKCKTFFVKGCLLPGHKVLTRDLRWIPIETLQKGDRLLTVTPDKRPRWVEAEVLLIKPVEKECCEVILEDGHRFRCTSDHPFMALNGTTRVWTEAAKLKRGVSRLAKVLTPWETPDTYDCGWSGGFLDGEGTLAQRNGGWGRRATLAAYQCEGAVLERARTIFGNHGFRVNKYPGNQTTRQLHILGGLSETMRALGTFRPIRLLSQFEPRGRHLRCAAWTTVREVVPLGRLREVVGLSTSAGTYIADGYAHHNTFYHDDEQGRSVDNVAESLRATVYEGLGIGRYAKEVLDLDVEGVILDVSHGISVSGGLYRAVAIDREMLWATLAAKMDQTPNADVIIRGHAHYFVHIEHSTRHGMILPAWQLQTSFMRKHSRYRMIPDLGAIVLHIDPEAKRKKEDPCHIEKRLYRLPKQRVVHL